MLLDPVYIHDYGDVACTLGRQRANADSLEGIFPQSNHNRDRAWGTGSLHTSRPCACRRRPRGDVLFGFLRRTPVNLNRAFEIRAVLDHDLRRRQIPDDRTVLLDLDPSLRAHVSLHVAVHHHVAGVDVSRHLRRRPDRQLPPLKLDQPFDRAVEQQILGAGDVAFHAQARPQPSRIVVRTRIQWTHRLGALRIRFLLTPHRRNLLTVGLGEGWAVPRRFSVAGESYSLKAGTARPRVPSRFLETRLSLTRGQDP